MSRKKCAIALIVSMAIMVAAQAGAVCHYSVNCHMPTDGIVFCQSECHYPASCQSNIALRCDQYCYDDIVVGVCHDGSQEYCCIDRAPGF